MRWEPLGRRRSRDPRDRMPPRKPPQTQRCAGRELKGGDACDLPGQYRAFADVYLCNLCYEGWLHDHHGLEPLGRKPLTIVPAQPDGPALAAEPHRFEDEPDADTDIDWG